jgi:hypothetical protein
MSILRLTGSTSGYSQITPPAIAGDQTFTLPSTGGTLDRLNRAGNVLQVVNATYGTQTTSSSSTYADTGLTASITPASASSKILIVVNHASCGKESSNTALLLRLLRGATELIVFEKYGGYTNNTGSGWSGTCGTCYLDSPATTSAVAYKTQLASSANTGTVYVQASSSGSPTSTITLMEVAA